MRARILFLVLLSVLAFAAFGMAQESKAFNLMVSDQDTHLIESFAEVRIYAIDPKTEKRLDSEPLFVLSKPSNPIQLWLDPGHYEFVVSVDYVRREVRYFRFEMVEGERNLINLRRIEFPEELMTR